MIDGNYPIPDVHHLRRAVLAHNRTPESVRPGLVKNITAAAKTLNATHLPWVANFLQTQT